MKKNLQLALALTLGLATTVSAQDWSVDSKTRTTNVESNGVTGMSTEQFARMGVSFGGDAVSVHASFNAYMPLGMDASSFGLHEAYASSNLLDYATVSAGRMALNFGSGRIIGSNDWANNGNTWDGFMFGINNDFADVTVGMANGNYGEDFPATEDLAAYSYEANQKDMFVNISKSMGDISFNATYVNNEFTVTETGFEDYSEESTTMGLEMAYPMANGIDLSLGYYTNEVDGEDAGQLTSLGASYGVNDNMSVFAGYDMYDAGGFYVASGNVISGAGTGMTAITQEGTDMILGGTYTMGDFSFSATMHKFESDLVDVEETAETEGVDYIQTMDVMDFNVSYTLSDNSSLGLTYSTNTTDDHDNGNVMWLGLNVGF